MHSRGSSLNSGILSPANDRLVKSVDEIHRNLPLKPDRARSRDLREHKRREVGHELRWHVVLSAAVLALTTLGSRSHEPG
jgi:hypothetical protein